MKRINRQIDTLIVRLKHLSEFENLRFVRAYGSHTAEQPLKDMTAVVDLKDVSLSESYIGRLAASGVRGDIYSASVEIRIYAPSDENSSLTETAGELIEALGRVDEEKIITQIGATSIKFDSDLNSVYRCVNFKVEFCLCEEAEYERG